MSENGIHSGIDPRAARTRTLLADALMSLGAARGIEAIEIRDLVEEAGIARSTFYAHFSDKDDFLIRSFVNLLVATERAYAQAYPDRTDVLPSRPLFQHVHDAHDFAVRMAQSEAFNAQMSAGEAKLRGIVETNVVRLRPDWSSDQRRDAAIYIAGGFIGLLRWWMQTGVKQSPEHMQAAFERITKSVLEG